MPKYKFLHCCPDKVKETLTPRLHPDSYLDTKNTVNQINNLVVSCLTASSRQVGDPACRLAG